MSPSERSSSQRPSRNEDALSLISFFFLSFFVIILSTSCIHPHMTPARLVWERASLLATLVSMVTASAERRRTESVGIKDGVFRVCEAVGDTRRHVSLSRLSLPNRPPAAPAVSQLRWQRMLTHGRACLCVRAHACCWTATFLRGTWKLLHVFTSTCSDVLYFLVQ